MTRRRHRHSAAQLVKKLQDADAMLAAGESVGEVLQAQRSASPRILAGELSTVA